MAVNFLGTAVKFGMTLLGPLIGIGVAVLIAGIYIVFKDKFNFWPFVKWTYTVYVFQRRGQTAQLVATTNGKYTRDKNGKTKFIIQSDPRANIRDISHTYISPNKRIFLYNTGKGYYEPFYFELGIIKVKVPVHGTDGKIIKGISREIELEHPLPKLEEDRWAWDAQHLEHAKEVVDTIQTRGWWERNAIYINTALFVISFMVMSMIIMNQQAELIKIAGQTLAAARAAVATPTPILAP